MDKWQAMFALVQSIVRNDQSLQQNLNQLVEFTRANPELCDELEFWDKAQTYDFQPDFATLTKWAKQGIEALGLGNGEQFLLLDLGDCPETFRLYKPGGQELMSQQKFRSTLSGKLVIGTSDLEDCFGSEVQVPFNLLFGRERRNLCDHSVSELPHSILNWTRNDSYEYHGTNGYLLWLMLGTLALIEPLRNQDFCRAILQGCDRLYLLSGYEEIFFYVATITPDGILFNTAL